jgi:phage terminase Nu1 subunit (DNA packaging protein)
MIGEAATFERLAQFWGVAPSTVATLASKHIVRKVAPGMADVEASTRSYLAHLRDQASGRDTHPDAKRASLLSSARLRDQQRALIALRLDRESGRLIDTTKALATFTRVIGEFKGLISALPDVAAVKLNLTNEQHGKMCKLVESKLQELADQNLAGLAVAKLEYRGKVSAEECEAT